MNCSIFASVVAAAMVHWQVFLPYQLEIKEREKEEFFLTFFISRPILRVFECFGFVSLFFGFRKILMMMMMLVLVGLLFFWS